MIKESFGIVFNNVRQRKIRSWLTLIGIFIGVAAVVALISLSQGLKTAVSEQFLVLGSDKIIVTAQGAGFGPPGTAITNALTKKDLDKMKSANGVDISLGRLIRIISIEFDDELRYTYCASVSNDKEGIELIVEANNYNVGEGKFLDEDSNYDLVLGYNVARDYFDKELEVGDKVKIQGKDFKLIGILESSGNPQRDDSILISEDILKEILDIGDEYDVLIAQVGLGEDIDSVSENIAEKLRKSRDVEEGKEDFDIQTPQQLLETLNSILLILQGFLVGVAAISLVVGAIGIMNTMYTSVLERTKEIGIMKSIGASRRQIQMLFLIESGVIGMFGGVIGAILGLSISKFVEYIAFLSYGTTLIKADINIMLILVAIIFSFFVGMASGFFPARQAANLTPVEALRK